MAGKLMKAVQYSGYGGGAGALQVNLIEFFKHYKFWFFLSELCFFFEVFDAMIVRSCIAILDYKN